MLNLAIRALFCLFLTGMITFACRKNESNGAVLIRVMQRGSAVPHAVVYMKAGTLNAPGLPASQYDLSRAADKSGLAAFDGLEPGSYYFYVPADSVSGGVGVTVTAKATPNRYEKTVFLQ